MRIQNNIMAMNTHRFYTANNNAVSKSAEKLSSGYRVNRAGDDAAGLAISEKMRAEIRGLSMASKNSQDGISMVQTAEGALTEVHSMLQRMKELAVQAASDSNADQIDRPALEQEFSQLLSEIDDVAETTTFNDMNLLDGTFANKVIQIGSRGGNEMDISIGKMSAFALGLRDQEMIQTDAADDAGDEAGAVSLSVGVTFADDDGAVDIAAEAAQGDTVQFTSTGGDTDIDVTFTLGADGKWATTDTVDGYDVAFDGSTFSITAQEGTTAPEDSPFGTIDATATIAAATGTVVDTVANDDATWSAAAAEGADDADADADAAEAAGLSVGVTFADDDGAVDIAAEAAQGDTVQFTSTGGDTDIDVTFTLGADGKWATTDTVDDYDVAFDGSTFSITAQDGTTVPEDSPFGTIDATATIAAATGTVVDTVANDDATWSTGEDTGTGTGDADTTEDPTKNGGINLLTQKTASNTIDEVYKAINLVSTERAKLGAIQNRLEHKISNLDNTVENVSAAEARIRDVDIAQEMTNFTKNQILSQAATAMLAQANSLPQNVLSLLQ